MTAITNASADIEAAIYDEKAYKLTVVISSRIDDRTAINTVGHVALALGAASGHQFLGKSWADAGGEQHAALARFPFITLAARPGKISKVISAAREHPDIDVIDYPEEGFTTTNDLDYRDTLAEKEPDSLVYIGAALFGPTDAVQELCGSLTLWSPRS